MVPAQGQPVALAVAVRADDRNRSQEARVRGIRRPAGARHVNGTSSTLHGKNAVVIGGGGGGIGRAITRRLAAAGAAVAVADVDRERADEAAAELAATGARAIS